MGYFSEDLDFCRKLKTFYSLDDEKGQRRTGRTTLLAKIIVEVAIESGESVRLQDHYIKSSINNMTTRALYEACRDYINELNRYGCGIQIVNNNSHNYNTTLHLSIKDEVSMMCYRMQRMVPYQMGLRENKKEVKKNLILLIC